MSTILNRHLLMKNSFKLVTIGATRLAHNSSIKSLNEIPGPLCLPLWGNLLHYKLGILDFKKYHEVLDTLYNKYGPIVKEKIGSQVVIHVFDPDDIKTVYANEGLTPYLVPIMETAQFYRQKRNIALGLGNVNGSEWYRLRSSVRPLMLKPQEAQSFLPDTQKVSKDFVSHLENIYRDHGKIDNLRDEVPKWALESAGVICFGKRLGSFNSAGKENVPQKIIDANRELFRSSAALKFSLPLYKYIPTSKWKRVQAAEDFIYSKTQEFMEETLKQLQNTLDEKKTEGNYRFLAYLMSKEALSKLDVTIITVSALTDGLSTTAPALLYNLYCLATNPDVQEKAYAEIERVLEGTDTVNVDVLKKISYIKAIVKETFRCYPGGTEVSRLLQKSLVLSGYQIPQGIRVDLTPNVHLKSEKYFKNADSYMPERWLRGNEATNHNPYILIPFGHGARTCIGRRFAEQDLYAALIHILRRFKLEYPSKSKPLKQVFETLLYPEGPVDIIFRPRNTSV